MEKEKKKIVISVNDVSKLEEIADNVPPLYALFLLLVIWFLSMFVQVSPGLIGELEWLYEIVDNCLAFIGILATVTLTHYPAIQKHSIVKEKEQRTLGRTLSSITLFTFGRMVAFALGYTFTGSVVVAIKDVAIEFIGEVIFGIFMSITMNLLAKFFLPFLTDNLSWRQSIKGWHSNIVLFFQISRALISKRDDAKRRYTHHIVRAYHICRIIGKMVTGLAGAMRQITRQHDLHRQALFEKGLFFCSKIIEA